MTSPELPIATTDSVGAQPLLARATGSKIALLIARFSRGTALVACALASYLLISHFLVQSVRVVGMSMVPTLQDSQMYLLNRWVLHFREPHRSEIVVLRDPLDGGFAVKRIVGVAGDSIYLSGGSVYVNGTKLDEAYLPHGTMTFTASRVGDQLFKCQPGQYFVLGDNRGNSLDSRVYGPVLRHDILGLIIR